jgi:hypothetical protein
MCVTELEVKLQQEFNLTSRNFFNEYVPDSSCSIQITSGTVTGTSSLFFEAVDGGTKFTTAGELDLAYFKLAKMIVKRKMNQQIKKDMLKLKDVLENGNRR